MKKTFPEITRLLSVNDLIAKIVCVLLAVLLWVYISNTNIGETQFKIPVNFTELPETLIKSKVSHRYVTITLTGKKDLLKNINIKNIKAVVNLDQPKIGKNNYPVEINKDELPENIEVNFSQKQIAVTVERKISKSVKVKINLVDKVSDGYMLGRIRIIPDTVLITGPESILTDIDFVKTVDISIADKKGRIIKEVPIDRSGLKGIYLNAAEVKVIIPVIESANLFKFEKKITIKNKNEKYQYILSNEEINVFIQSENAEIEPYLEDFDAFIDFSKINIDDMFKGTNKDYVEKNFTVDIALKKTGMRIISIVPDVITVKIMKNQ
ncbi:MAG: hypothetical protein JW864_00775 [Spirochaetes bacterium]|nr:hypothetical protein [Spirochaetota bacterium]